MPVHTNNYVHYNCLYAPNFSGDKWLSNEKDLQKILDSENDVDSYELRYRKRDLKSRENDSKENGKQGCDKENGTHASDEENKPRKKISRLCLKNVVHDIDNQALVEYGNPKKNEKNYDYGDANKLENTSDKKNEDNVFDMIKLDWKMSESDTQCETKQIKCKNDNRKKTSHTLDSLSLSRSANKKLNMWAGRLRTTLETRKASNESQLNHLQHTLEETKSKLTLPKLFQTLNWTVSRSKSDGHCLLYSVVSSWSKQMLIDPKPRQLTYESLLQLVSHEAQSNSHLYKDFLTESYTK